MGVPHALVQVVHPQDDSIELRTWNQVVQSGRFEDLLEAMRTVPNLSITPTDFESASEMLRAGELLCFLGSPAGDIWQISIDKGTLEDRIGKISELIHVAERVGPLERTGQVLASDLAAFFPALAGLIVLHNFVVEEVMIASSKGICLPSGITRFVISPRALRINYPLERLLDEAPRREKQAQLDEWVKRQLKNRSVRYYAESTFLYDE
jgi:hypothetical protein